MGGMRVKMDGNSICVLTGQRSSRSNDNRVTVDFLVIQGGLEKCSSEKEGTAKQFCGLRKRTSLSTGCGGTPALSKEERNPLGGSGRGPKSVSP